MTSPLEQACNTMHELFLTLQRAGFTEDQALRLVAIYAATLRKEEDR